MRYLVLWKNESQVPSTHFGSRERLLLLNLVQNGKAAWPDADGQLPPSCTYEILEILVQPIEPAVLNVQAAVKAEPATPAASVGDADRKQVLLDLVKGGKAAWRLPDGSLPSGCTHELLSIKLKRVRSS